MSHHSFFSCETEQIKSPGQITDMSLGSRAGVRHLLSFLVFLTAYHVKGDQVISKERHYYIAAVEIDWDYSGNTTHR